MRTIPQIHGFADDSITDRVATCAVAVFDAEHVSDAEGVVARHLSHLGLPKEARIHCWELFHGDARARTIWAGVGVAAIKATLESICLDLKPLSYPPVVVIGDISALPSGWAGPDGKPWTLDAKGIATLAYHRAFGLIGHEHGPTNVRLWIDPDKTKIPWADGRRQAQNTRRVHVEFRPGDEPYELVPDVTTGPKPRLIDIADLYAYTAARVKSSSGEQRDRWFEVLYRHINPREIPGWSMPNTLDWQKGD